MQPHTQAPQPDHFRNVLSTLEPPLSPTSARFLPSLLPPSSVLVWRLKFRSTFAIHGDDLTSTACICCRFGRAWPVSKVAFARILGPVASVVIIKSGAGRTVLTGHARKCFCRARSSGSRQGSALARPADEVGTFSMAAADHPHELSWVHQEDVVFKILSTACQDPFCKAACVCKGWNAAMSYAREHHWRTLKRALLGRRAEAHHARMHGIFSAEAAAEFDGVVSHADLDQELRSEIDRLVRSCGTVLYDRRIGGRLQSPKIGCGPAVLSFN